MPPSGEGTSIEALSDSRVTRGCSGLTVSPALTMTSMIGTSLNSPMSGTRTSATPAGALVGAGGEETAGLTGFAAGPAPSSSRLKIGVPWLTLSPILIATLFTTPAYGDGTSIDALSDSSVMSGASASTRSALLHLEFDDRDILEVADIGNEDLSDVSHYNASLDRAVGISRKLYQTVQGGGLSGSMPYFVIASLTLALGTAPSSASNFRAAIAT